MVDRIQNVRKKKLKEERLGGFERKMVEKGNWGGQIRGFKQEKNQIRLGL